REYTAPGRANDFPDSQCRLASRCRHCLGKLSHESRIVNAVERVANLFETQGAPQAVVGEMPVVQLALNPDQRKISNGRRVELVDFIPAIQQPDTTQYLQHHRKRF